MLMNKEINRETEREKLLFKAFQRGHLLTLNNKFYKDWVKSFILNELKWDTDIKGDITSNAILKYGKNVKAVVYSRVSGIVSGIEEVSLLLQNYKIKIKQLRKDGDELKKGTKIFLLEGDVKNIFKLERLILDILSRMSGIATLTNNLIKQIKKMNERNSKLAIASTRKTPWCYLDKKAVYTGGGLTHRLALWESILIKDNHLKALKKENVKDNITTALERAWKNKKNSVFIEIEARNEKQAIKSAEKFRELKINCSNNKHNNNHYNKDMLCLIMLDNMNSAKIKKIIKKLKTRKLFEYVLIEASGSITPDNIKRYANSGVDVLSLSYLTTSAKNLDIKMEMM